MSKNVQLMLWDCNGLTQQNWAYDSNAETVSIDGSSSCLDLWEDDQVNGQALHIWECLESGNQKWEMLDSSAPGGASPTPPAPSPPGPDCAAVGGWPKFTSYQQLKNDKWGRYFEAVYGGIPAVFPICLSDLQHLYMPKLQAAGVSLPALAADCPSKTPSEGEFYTRLSRHQDKSSVWIYHNPSGFKLTSKTWVEFMHQPSPGDQTAVWMYHAPGTAIWFNLGTTQVFNDHDDAVKELLNVPCTGSWHGSPECGPEFGQLYKTALGKGLNSIQFLKHADMDCGPRQWRNLAIEIIDLGGPGTLTCGSNTYKAGWNHEAKCNCDESQTAVNCVGFGMRGSGGIVEFV